MIVLPKILFPFYQYMCKKASNSLFYEFDSEELGIPEEFNITIAMDEEFINDQFLHIFSILDNEILFQFEILSDVIDADNFKEYQELKFNNIQNSTRQKIDMALLLIS